MYMGLHVSKSSFRLGIGDNLGRVKGERDLDLRIKGT